MPAGIETRHAIIYAAKSTQDTHGSIPTQLEDCRAAAEAESSVIAAEYTDEAYSAYSGSRGPGLKAAMDHAEQIAREHGEAHLFVQHSDRLARGDGKAAAHLVEYALWAIKAGVKLRSLQDPQTFGDLLYTVVTGQRNHEDSKRKSQATRAGKKREAQRGRPNGGIPPYGYCYEGRREECRLVPIPAEAAIVRRVFTAYAAGESQLAILRQLNAEHVPTKRGGQRWSLATLGAILRSPLYIGKVKHRGETYDGQHEPLIDVDLWERVQRLRAAASGGPGRGRGRQPKARHLFVRGMLRCGSCGGAMIPRSASGKNADRYYCLNRIENGPDACAQTAVPRKQIDSAALSYFESAALDMAATRAEFEAAVSQRVNEAQALRQQAERDLSQRTSALSRVEADYLAGTLGADNYQRLSAKLADELDALRAQVEQLSAQEREAANDGVLEDAEAEMLAYLTEIRAAIVGDVRAAEGIEAVRAALRSLFDSFTYTRTMLSADGRLCEAYVLEAHVRADAVESSREIPALGAVLSKPRKIPLSYRGNNQRTASALRDLFAPIPCGSGAPLA